MFMDPSKHKRPQFSLRVLFLLVTILAFLLWAIPLAYESWMAVPTVPLSIAVSRFNIEASLDDVGVHQPPLTVKEVLAAISATLPTLNDAPSTKAIFARIVTTQQIPVTAKLYFTTTYDSGNGAQRKVWWINLDVMTGKRTGYSLRIRDANAFDYLIIPLLHFPHE